MCNSASLIQSSQDGMEFSPPRIHSPYYNIDDTCNPYAKDEKLFLETFQKHFKHPQEGSARSGGAAERPLLLPLVTLLLLLHLLHPL